MATNGKAKTTYSIIYGDLPYEAAEGILTPAILGPRYELHRPYAGFADSYVGRYLFTELRTASYNLASDIELPGKTDGGVVDISSIRVLLNNCYIENNATPITGTKITGTGGTIQTSVNLVNSPTLRTAVTVGDRVYLTGAVANGTTITKSANIIALDGTYEAAAPVLSDVANLGTLAADNIFTAVASDNADSGEIRPVAYLIKVTKVDVSSGQTVSKVTVSIQDLVAGGAVTSEEVNIGGVLELDGIAQYNLKLAASGVTTAKVRVNDTFRVVYGADSTVTYDKVVTDTDVNVFTGNISLKFAEHRTVATYQPLSTGYWSLNNTCIVLNDELRTDIGKVMEAEVYVQYRELITTYAGTPVLSTASNISEVVGVADPENPMGMAFEVYIKAIGTYGPAGCFFVQVAEDTVDGYAEAINRLGKYQDIYSVVPLTSDEAVADRVLAFVANKSAKDVAEFKTAWISCGIDPRKKLQLGGEQLTVLVSGNSTNISLMTGDALSAGVMAGDIVSIVFGYDTDTDTYDTAEFIVKVVSGSSTIELTSPTPANITGVFKASVYRKLSAGDYAEALAAKAAAINSARCKYVAGDTINFNEFSNVEKCYAAVSNAVIRAALPPHAPLTDLTLPGFSMTETVGFSDLDMEVMNAGGVWLIFPNSYGDAVNYHQITTKTDGKVSEEDSVVSNVDSIVREIKEATKHLSAGSSNASDVILEDIEAKIHAVMGSIAAIQYDTKYGPRFEEYEIIELSRLASNRQKIRCRTRIVTALPQQDSDYEFVIM